MKTSLKKEITLVIIMLLPLIVLYYVWSDLPELLPIHFNIEGEADDYASKDYFSNVILMLTALPYFIGLLVPYIDPKKKIQAMGSKYYSIRLTLSLFLSSLAILIIYMGLNQDENNNNLLIVLLGLFFLFLGNYMKALKPNYFIGIKTPWALENEYNWKKTHELGGKLWFIGGILIVITSLVFNENVRQIVFVSSVIIMSVIPMAYSYLLFRKGNNESL